MNSNRIEGAVRRVRGSVKEAIGKIVGNVQLRAEGRAEKIAGDVQARYGQSSYSQSGDAVEKHLK